MNLNLNFNVNFEPESTEMSDPFSEANCVLMGLEYPVTFRPIDLTKDEDLMFV